MKFARDSRWVSLIILCVGMLMIVLDGTVVNVALPSIQTDLGFSAATLAWVINAYLIAFGGLLLLAGRLGDLIGTKRIFLVGIFMFTLASLLCGVAFNQAMLIGARFLQGIGGAMASSVILAMIVSMFAAPQERARAMSIFSFTASAGGSVGLLLGGTMTQALNWHWVFLINIPIGIATFYTAHRYLKSTPGIGLREGADVVGAFLVTAALMTGVYAVVEIPTAGISSARTMAFGAVGIALFIAFLVRQARTEKPLMQLSIFKSRNISGSNALQALIVAGMYGSFFLEALFLRRLLGYSAVATGLAFLPVTLTIGAFSLGWSVQLATRFGARQILIAGSALASVGLGIFALTPPGASYLTAIFPAMLLLGFGMGISFPPLMLFAMSDADANNSGVVSGLLNTTAQIGGAFGLAILATAAAARTQAMLADGSTNALALTGGYQVSFAIAAGCLVAATIIAATVLTPIDLTQPQHETH
ncbi:MAG: DHA2 family efflux MFS transporter permease subunit [Candidatus Eremiobacteraeota bacterium]|nr:DHA2 family efflux MFS transporter permease subunit [Candidatus Eremiobacteraeota bacterium]